MIPDYQHMPTVSIVVPCFGSSNTGFRIPKSESKKELQWILLPKGPKDPIIRYLGFG